MAFWVTRLLCLAFSQTFYSYQPGDKLAKTVQSFLSLLKTMPLQIISFDMVYCYIVIYYLVPKFLAPKKYRLFAFNLIIITLTIIFFSICVGYFVEGLFKNDPNRLLVLSINMIRLVLIFGAPAVAVFFLAVKMFKTWYLKQQEKQMLITANAEAEIQLLKAQIHPHFLFNTLNNIYSFTLAKSDKAGELVLQLEDMLKYMVDDCVAALVPLDKEIKIVRDYMSLEKVRYGNHLELEIKIIGDYQHKLIAPLLMIPFVENAFKHGASKMLENPWVKLKIVVEKNRLHFDISNNKLPQPVVSKNKSGIGLRNVEKRLGLLYADEYSLLIEPADNTFSVQMQVPLKIPVALNEPGLKNNKRMEPV
jgi:sensor histidine kinase YesM